MRYKIIVYILFILFALGLICIGHLSHAQGRPGSLYTATVLRIIDGDTIHVRDMAPEYGHKARSRQSSCDNAAPCLP